MLGTIDELEQKLKKLILTEQQKRIAAVLLQMDGKKYKSQKEIITAVFGDDAKKVTDTRGIYDRWRREIMKKIAAALDLPGTEWQILIRLDSWWQDFNERFGHCAIAEVVERRRSLMPAQNQARYEHLRNYEIDLEARLRKIRLIPIQEFIATKVFQLDEQRKWVIYRLAESLIKFKLGVQAVPSRAIKSSRIEVRGILKTVENKVGTAAELPPAERKILESLDPWYRRLFDVYPKLSKTDIKSFIKNCFGVSGLGERTRQKRSKNGRIERGKRSERIALDTIALWKQALAGSPASADSELMVPGAVLNEEMLKRAFCRGMEIVNKVAGQLRRLGEFYGFEMMDLVQEAGAIWWMMLKEWPGGTKDEFDAFVRETSRAAIRGMFSHPALVGPSCAVPLAELRRFVKQAIKHRLTYGEELTLADLRREFGWDDEQFENYQDLMRLSWRHFSSITEAAFDDDKKGERKEARIPSTALNPEEVIVDSQRTVAKELLVSWLEDSLNQLLAPLERLILRYRFGFDSEEMKPMSVEEVARVLNTPVQVIGRLEDQAIAKLRKNEELKRRYQVSLQILKQAERALK